IVVAGENDAQREGARQAPQGQAGGLDGRVALIEIVGDEVEDGFGVRLGFERVPLGDELVLQLLEVLDDAVVDHSDAVVHVRMGIALDRAPVRRPAGMADAGAALERLLQKPRFEIPELALGAAPVEMAVLHRGDARRIIAAILEPPERIDEVPCNGFRAKNADDPAHCEASFFRRSVALLLRRGCLGLNSNRIAWFFESYERVCAFRRFMIVRNLAAQPSRVICSLRSSASASAGTSFVTTLPEPMNAPSPTETGATRDVFEPMKAPGPISVRYLKNPS